jgi:hypothetical protein
VGTRSPHRGSKERKIGDISPVPTLKKEILGLMVRFRVSVTIRIRVRFRVGS